MSNHKSLQQSEKFPFSPLPFIEEKLKRDNNQVCDFSLSSEEGENQKQQRDKRCRTCEMK
jgi:hypothetical protein